MRSRSFTTRDCRRAAGTPPPTSTYPAARAQSWPSSCVAESLPAVIVLDVRLPRVLVAMRVRATPERAFEAFTADIAQWWKPNGLFQFRQNHNGTLAFEPGPSGRLVEHYDDGTSFEVGRITVWDPPRHLVVGWREASFADDQTTELHVRFAPIGNETRITVEHFGWDSLPRQHAARHGAELLLPGRLRARASGRAPGRCRRSGPRQAARSLPGLSRAQASCDRPVRPR